VTPFSPQRKPFTNCSRSRQGAAHVQCLAPLTLAPLTLAPLTLAPLTLAPLTLAPLTPVYRAGGTG
jgi:hypothetical protein